MLKQGKIRQRAFSLRFFSNKTKLILSLVFVLVIAGICSYNYLRDVEAANLAYTENFYTTNYKDTSVSDGHWVSRVEPGNYIMGDANGDSNISDADADILISCVAGLPPCTCYDLAHNPIDCKPVLDLDNDGFFGANDLTVLFDLINEPDRARLWGREWSNMAETANGFENISVLTDNASNSDIKVGTDNIVYALWEVEVTPLTNEIYFAKYTPGIGWTDMDGTLGGVNLSNTPTPNSYFASLALDSNNIPYVVFSDDTGGLHVVFRRWHPASGSWTNMAGTGSQDILAGHLAHAQIAINNNDQVFIVSEGTSDTVISTWSGTVWQGLTGSTDYDAIGYNTRPRMIINSQEYPQVIFSDLSTWYFTRWSGSDWVTMDGSNGYEIITIANADWTNVPGFVLDNANNPYIAWVDFTDGDQDIYFSHWNGTAWTSMSGLATFEDISLTSPAGSSSPDLKLDSSNNPYVVWRENNNEIYFTRWSGSAWTNLSGLGSFDNISSNVGSSRLPLIQINADDEIFVTWIDDTTGNGDVYFVRGNVGAVWNNLRQIPGYSNISADANPSSIYNINKLGTNFILDSAGKLYLSWFTTIAGNDVLSFTKIIPNYQSPGILQSININSGADFIINATISANQTLNGQTISYSLSNDGGVSWESATNNTLHTFATQGNDLRWKANLTGTASVTPAIDNLDISYQTKKIFCSIDSASLIQGSQQTIRATLSFTPPDPSTNVWATIEKDGVLLSTVIMSNTSGNNYVGTYTTGAVNLGQNDVAVFASDGTSSYVCNPSVGANWQKTTLSSMPWHKRGAHEVLSYNGYLWILGGYTDDYDNDIWKSRDGDTWEMVTSAAPWAGRKNFGSAVFDNKMWIFGGDTYLGLVRTYYNDVWWSTDGLNWTQIIYAPGDIWSARVFFSTAIYDDKIWISGGYDGVYKDDLWYTSDPTAEWTNVTMSAGFGALAKHQMVAYDDGGGERLWILGGQNLTLPYAKNTVWQSDATATNWISSVAPWSARYEATAIVYDYPADSLGSKILIMAGADNANTILSDVWSYEDSEGWLPIVNPLVPYHHAEGSLPSSWTNWSARFRTRTVVHNPGSGNEIFLIGGYEYGVREWNDVWTTTNGSNWILHGTDFDGIFNGRWSSTMAGFNNKLWILGGQGRNDVWSSPDGAVWTKDIADGNPLYWTQRWSNKSLVYDNKLWVIGGCKPNAGGGGTYCGGLCTGGVNNGLGCTTGANCPGGQCLSAALNDVWWSANGTTWTQATAAANFVGRYEAATAVYDNKMWILGGDTTGICVGGTYNNQICRVDGNCPGGGICSNICVAGLNIGQACPLNSCGVTGKCGKLNLDDALYSTDGSTWTLATGAPGWSGRSGHGAVGYNGKLWVMGGWDGTRQDDIWFSTDGSAWTEAIANLHWDGRYTFALLDYDDKMWVFGGNNGYASAIPGSRMDSNNVWWSVDGINWNESTSWADWDGRDFFSSTVFNNRMWLMGGDSMGGGNNDVWASSYNFTDLNFTVNAPGGSIFLPSLSAPSNLTCQAIDLTENNILVKAINWNFVDTADNEFGFRLYDGETIIKEVPTQDLTQIQEKENLLSNKAYTRNVRAYNGNGTSSASALATCYTLANKPNIVDIMNITADSITIKLDPNDGNPPETLYAIRVISGTITSFVNPDGSFSTAESWHTYAEFGGIDGIILTGLTPDQNYSFSAKAKNGDTPAIETVYSDISNSIPQPETGPNISATKGVAVNLAWNSGFGLFSTALAGNNLVINLNGTLNRGLGVLAWLLNIIILILLAVFGISLVKTLKHLKHEYKYPDTFKLIWSIITKEAHQTYVKHAPQTQEGVYHSSAYHQHKKFHNLSQNTFIGATAVVGLKLMILGALLSGFMSLNSSSLAASAPYNQSGTNVNVGDTLTYIVEVTNTGTVSAQDLVISDVLSGYLTYESGTSGINYDSNTNTITYSISSLGINENASMTFKAKVIAGSEEKLITNTANVSGSNFITIVSNLTSNQVGSAIPINENINQPIINENINQPPINENINQPIINENTNQPPINENTNQPPANGNTNQPPVEPPVSGTTESQVPIIGPIIDSINEVFDYIGQLAPVKFINEVVFDNPKVEQNSQNVVTPLIITIAIVNTLPAVLVITTYLLPYLHLIFLEPLLFLFGKKRKKWGVVYNSLTKKPVDLALVRLYNKENNQLIQTKVTDREGRYIMIAKEPGKYYLSVTKPGFIIPSSYLRGETQDTKYIDLYHGEVIEVTEKDAVITANIPLDPAEKKSLAFAEIVRSYLLKNLRLIVSYVGLILSLIIVLIIPTAITIGALVIHVLLFLFFRRFLVPAKPKSWGIVYDAKTKEPLGSSVVRIFDMKFNKLLETQVTDSKGRYSFLVGQNQYQMLAEKPGYQNKEVKPVDLVKNEEIVNLDVGLNKI